jgi:ribonuclease D
MACKTCHPTHQHEPKILYFDTENSPSFGAYYGKRWDTSILWATDEWRFLMFSYAWNDSPAKVVQSWSELSLVKSMWKLIDEADIVIAHNASFDMGHFYSKCLEYHLPTPRPPKVVCTLKMYRKLGKFESNKLDDLCEKLGLGNKVSLPKNFWRSYLDRDPKSVKKAKVYAKHDVVLLRKLYKEIASFFPRVKFTPKV